VRGPIGRGAYTPTWLRRRRSIHHDEIAIARLGGRVECWPAVALRTVVTVSGCRVRSFVKHYEHARRHNATAADADQSTKLTSHSGILVCRTQWAVFLNDSFYGFNFQCLYCVL